MSPVVSAQQINPAGAVTNQEKWKYPEGHWFVSMDETTPSIHPQESQETKGTFTATFYSSLLKFYWAKFQLKLCQQLWLTQCLCTDYYFEVFAKKVPFISWKAQHQGWIAWCPCVPGGSHLAFVTDPSLTPSFWNLSFPVLKHSQSCTTSGPHLWLDGRNRNKNALSLLISLIFWKNLLDV